VVAGAGIAEIESPDLLEWQREFLDAGIEVELAALQLERDRSLVADGIVAERRLEEALARDRAARTRLSQARQQLAIAGFGAGAIDALAVSGTLTSRLTLRAPIDGVVTARFVDPGARVAAMDPVLSFADPSEIWVEMHLPAERAVAVDAGMRIRIPLGERAVIAPITVVGTVIDPETQTVLVRAELDDPDPRLRAGQFLAVEVVTGDNDARGYRLPASALVRQGDQAYVFVRDGNAFEPVRIEPVHEDDRNVLIAAGITADAQVAVRGTSTLKSLWLASLEGESE
jgi:RND family efflux transporter MFP subunit